MSGTSAAQTDPGAQMQTALGAGYSPDEIIGHLQASNTNLGAKVRTALGHGYTAAQIVDHLNPAVAGSTVQGVPVLGAIGRGVAGAEAQAANLMDDLGLTGAGHAVRSTLNQEDLTAPTTGGDLVSSIKAGHYGRALSDIPGAVLESAPAIAAGAAGVAAAPLVGAAATPAALGAGALYGAATAGDSIARARAANNGDQAPTAGDLAVGLGAGAGIGSLGSVGDGLAGVLGTSATRGLIGRILGLGASQAQRAGADAAMPQLQALASTAGTNAGAQGASGADSTAAALTGLATRAGFSVPDALSSLPPVTSAGRAAALADKWNSLDTAGQQNATDVAAAGQALRASMEGAPSLSPKQAAASVIADNANGVAGLASKLQQVGAIDADGRSAIGNALAAARDSGKALTPDHLAAVGDLGLDDSTNGALQDTLRRINLLSAVDDSGAGPFEAIGKAAGGPLAGIALGGLTGGHAGAEVGAILGSLVKPIAGDRLGQLGAALDDRLGTTPTPSLVKSGDAAASMLNAAGVQLPDTSGALQDSFNASRDAVAQQRSLIAQQSDAIAMNRQFDRNTAADWQSTLRDAYGTNAEADKIEAARQAMTTDLNRRATLQERAADQVSGMAYRAAQDAREAGLTGAAATQVSGSPSSIFQATGGRLGSPVDDAPNMSGIVAPSQPGAAPTSPGPTQGSTGGFTPANDPGQPNAPVTPPPAAPQAAPSPATPPSGPVRPPQAAPAASSPPGSMQALLARYQGAGPAMGGAASPVAAAQGAPAASNDPVVAALARSQLAQLIAPSRRPATDLSALPAAAQAQAQKLSEAVWQHGRNLEDALVASGQARPVNMQQEWNTSLDALAARGWLDPQLAGDLKTFRGRVVPSLYDLIRSETLGRNNVIRTVGGGAG